MNDDIERMFQQEIREKKRTATGIHHRASRRGYTGTVRTHVDFLKGKEKREYIKAGEIKVTNMYDDIKNIPSLDELEKMDFNTAKGIVGKAKVNFKTKDLAKHWGITLYSLYNKAFKKYGLFEGNYGGLGKNIKKENKKENTKSKTKTEKVIDIPKPELKVSNPEPEQQQLVLQPIIKQQHPIENDFTGFEVKFGGKYTGKQITDRLMNYISILAENSDYKVIFKIEEIKNKIDYLEVAADQE